MLRRSFKNIQKLYAIRTFRTSTCNRSKDNNESDDKELSSSIATRFQVFKDESVGIIFDIEEERAKRRLEDETGVIEEEEHELLPSKFADLNLERGKTGVYDIAELVELLRKENAIDLCVIRITKNISYADHMCIITGSSYRHMIGMANFVRKVYKLKRHTNDHIPKIEGKNCRNWMCMDMGNIILHIFSKAGRETYSLETLWTLGEEYEKRTKKFDKVDEIYEEYLKQSDSLIESESQKI